MSSNYPLLGAIKAEVEARAGVCRCGWEMDGEVYIFTIGGIPRACCKGCAIESEICDRHVVLERSPEDMKMMGGHEDGR